jgi:2-isopropylmalate synthase
MQPITIFDTTLRDGEQSPGASMTPDEKLRMALQLEKLGVDVIEAGFAASSEADFRAVQAIARSIQGAAVCALARTNPTDVAQAVAAVREAARPRVHVFIATSELHMARKLRMSRRQVLAEIDRAVRQARQGCADVEFSAEDASRSDRAFLLEAVQAAVDAGAATVNIPDTVGYATPWEYADLIRAVRAGLRDAERTVLSVHCHDDLGMAVANSLAAVNSGARQIECTVNGIGERAGNAAIEEVVMALRTRRDTFGADTAVNAAELIPTSRLFTEITGIHVPPNKAIVGANAFAHESGIHQDGMLKDRSTYEVVDAEAVGAHSALVLGKHSGRSAIRERLHRLGYDLTTSDVARVLERVKAFGKREITDTDLVGMV